jgi:hypothetical protein
MTIWHGWPTFGAELAIFSGDRMATNHAEVALLLPAAYQGKVDDPRDKSKQITVIEAATYLGLPPLLARVGEWAVSYQGIHCLGTRFVIEKHLFHDTDWVRQMSEKPWGNTNDFARVFAIAVRMKALEVI